MADMPQLRQLIDQTIAAHDAAAMPGENVPMHWRDFQSKMGVRLLGKEWNDPNGKPIPEVAFLKIKIAQPRPGNLAAFEAVIEDIKAAIAMPPA